MSGPNPPSVHIQRLKTRYKRGNAASAPGMAPTACCTVRTEEVPNTSSGGAPHSVPENVTAGAACFTFFIATLTKTPTAVYLGVLRSRRPDA